jgi:predicted short-subunit dehydrogenase-like oxidoreductase (DUF2520 family)
LSHSSVPRRPGLNRLAPNKLALVGPGRAGTTLALALAARGRAVVAVAGRAPDARSTVEVAARLGAPPVRVEDAGHDADLVIVAPPDAAVADAVAGLAPSLRRGALVVHLAGSLGLAAFDRAAAQRPDVRFGALHPLVSIPSPEIGRARLPGAWCAIAGDPEVIELASELGMQPFSLADADRARYHAAAAVAANHVVALLGQVARLAELAGVPFEAFLPLVRSAVDNTAALGPAAALTGPVARGDAGTVEGHLHALPPDERDAYRALAAEALRLAARDDVALRALLDPGERVP